MPSKGKGKNKKKKRKDEIKGSDVIYTICKTS